MSVGGLPQACVCYRVIRACVTAFCAGAYTTWLWFPALLGIPMFFDQIGENKVGVVWLPIYAILIILWGSMFFEFWKRQQADLAMRWGTSGTCPQHVATYTLTRS